MHHIRAKNIPLVIRRPHLTTYAAQLRQALRDPSLPAVQRQKLEARLARIREALRDNPA